MFRIFSGFHRHKAYEKAIVSLSEDVSSIRMELATMRAKYAVTVREKKKLTGIDAEIRSMEEQLGGKAVAWKDEKGVLQFPGGDDNADG